MLKVQVPVIDWNKACVWAGSDQTSVVAASILDSLSGITAIEIDGHASDSCRRQMCTEVMAVVEGSSLDEDFNARGLYGAGVVLLSDGSLSVCGGVYNGGSTYLYPSSPQRKEDELEPVLERAFQLAEAAGY